MQIYPPSKGFTLIEVLLVVAVISILMSICEPSFQDYYETIKTRALTRKIIDELLMARNEAFTKQKTIRYCAEDSWEGKRIIKDQDGILLHSFSELPSSFHLQLKNSLGKNNCITFLPEGFTNFERGSFYLWGQQKRLRIVVSVSGKIRVEENYDSKKASSHDVPIPARVPAPEMIVLGSGNVPLV